MNRYVIVCLINGKAQEFHEKLVKEVCSNFKVSPQKLPMHITLKAPFEINNINEIESITENFCRNNKFTDVIIKNYGYFRKNVVYMDVLPSKEAVEVHDKYVMELKKISNLEWSNNEGIGRKMHCTVVSRKIESRFNEIWAYVNNHPAEFQCKFDNISIMEYDFINYFVGKSIKAFL